MFRRTARSALIALVFSLVAGVGLARAADIKIGIVAPMTGSEAADGKDMENAVKLAAATINAKGGVLGNKISTVTADDACDPQQGVNAASKLVSEGVLAVVGGYCSGGVLPTLKIYGDAGIPFVICCANSTKLITANPGNAFMENSTGDAQVKTAIELLKRKGVKTLSVIDEGDAYSSDLSRIIGTEWPKAGGSVVSSDTVTKGEQDFSSLITGIKAKKPDAIFWTAYYAGGGPLVKQVRQSGYKGLILLGDGNNSPDLIKVAGAAAEGAYILSPPVLEFLPGAGAFIGDYKKMYNQGPGAYAAMSYDAVSLIADAIKRAGGTDQKKIIASLKTSNFKGLAGQISFAGDNTLAHSNFSTLVDKGGKWQLAQ